jgi:hypothetical protein
MNSVYVNFLQRLLYFSAVTGLALLAATLALPAKYVSPALPFLIPFFIAATLISFRFLLRTLNQRFIRFVNTFMLTIIVKLFLYLGVMIAYVFINRADAIPFILGFFILYLCYTVFEAVSVVRQTGRGSAGSPGSEA